MKNCPLVSIVVPVYNVERYLDKCLSSLINQTYQNTEIIIVNDGSTDNSAQVIDKYKLIDRRISVISQPNGGLASARNAGVRIAQGDYIMHIDSDDYLDADSINDLVTTAIKNFSDIVISGYKLVDYEYNEYDYRTARFGGTITGYDALTKMLDHEIGGEVWTKLYKRDLYVVNKIVQDEEYSQVEDTMLNFQMFSYAKKVTACNKFTVYHVLRRGSYSDSSKTLEFRLKHHNGILKMAAYGFKSHRIKESYYGYLFRDFLQILKLKNIKLINSLLIDQNVINERYLQNITCLPKKYIKQKFILTLLYPFIFLGFSNIIARMIMLWIKITFH